MANTDPLGPAGDPEEWGSRPHRPAADGEFVKDREGILLPRPSGKSIRQVVFKSELRLNVEETQEEIQRRIGHLRETSAHWLTLTDAEFGEPMSVPTSALDDIMWLAEAWIDMTAAREQMKQRDMANRMQRNGIQVAPAGLNREMRRRR